MAVYWLDPYIDAAVGGIHGTTDTTTRNGTYAYPIGFTDVITSGYVVSIGGTNLVGGDEIRIKGQSFSSFLYNIGTTGNKIPISSINSNGLNYDSSYETNLTTLKSEYTANSETVGVIAIYDPGMMGTDKWMIASTGSSNSFPGVSNYVPFVQNNYNPLSGWCRAKYGIDVNDGVEVAFIDPDYFIDITSSHNGTDHSILVFNISGGITVTDGWDSSTTQNGVTILPLQYNSTTNFNANWWNSNSSYSDTYDLSRTYICYYNPTNYQVYNEHRQYFYNMDENDFKLRGWYCATRNAWNYLYFTTNTTSTTGTDPTVEYGYYCQARYMRPQGNGDSNNRPIIKMSNLFVGMGLYSNSNYFHWIVGNFMVYTQYSGQAMIYNNSTTFDFTVLANAHVFGYTSTPALFYNTVNGTVTIPITVTNFSNAPTNYPYTGISSSGPAYTGIKAHSRYLVDDDSRITLEPTSWTTTVALNPTQTTQALYVYNYGSWSSCAGVLDTEGADYTATNSNIWMINRSYQNLSYYPSHSFHFASNTYDGKPIGLWQPLTTAIGNAYNCLISYNDSNGNMIAQCTNNINNEYFMKSFIFKTPDLTGSTTLDFSMDITRSRSDYLTTNPVVSLFNIINGSQGTRHTASVSLTDDTWTFTRSQTGFYDNSDYIGVTIRLYNPTGASYLDKYTITDPTFTVS